MDPIEGINGNSFGCWWFLLRKQGHFYDFGLFLVMMSLGKKHLFLATLKCHSGPPPSPITLSPIFLNFSTPKWGGEILGPNQTLPGGTLGGGGGTVLLCHILLHPSPLKSS